MTEPVSYYGRPIVKEPVWKPEIPTYFFTGGLAGASATLTLAARLAGNDVLARRALLVNTAAIIVSPALLIKDLGRPMRFLNMLRVFKVTSPMSLGTWIVSASGTASGIGATCEVLGILPRVKAAAETVAGLLGPFLSTYTAALVSDSVVPVWHGARRELPFVFAGSSCASAGGAVAMFTPCAFAGPARRLAVVGAALELAATKAMEDRLGDLVGEPYHEDSGGMYAKAAKAATAAGGLLMAVAGRKRLGAIAAGSLLMAGAACQRFAVYHAGKQSARDPRYTSIPQRQRRSTAKSPPTSARPTTSHAT
ncbi:MAG TPA: NrfD/PsrC family molybdoenzyme membrane anchor subunit [Gaiellaceae bacterium]